MLLVRYTANISTWLLWSLTTIYISDTFYEETALKIDCHYCGPTFRFLEMGFTIWLTLENIINIGVKMGYGENGNGSIWWRHHDTKRVRMTYMSVILLMASSNNINKYDTRIISIWYKILKYGPCLKNINYGYCKSSYQGQGQVITFKNYLRCNYLPMPLIHSSGPTFFVYC